MAIVLDLVDYALHAPVLFQDVLGVSFRETFDLTQAGVDEAELIEVGEGLVLDTYCRTCALS